MLGYLGAFVVSFISSFTLAVLIAMGFKVLFLGIFMALFGHETALKLQRPLDFVSGLLHGTVSILLAKSIFDWFTVPIDFSFALFLFFSYLWYGYQKIRQLPKQLERMFSTETPQAAVLEQLSKKFGDMDAENPFTESFNQSKKQQMEMLENMRSSQIIWLIGRSAGLLIAGIKYLPFSI